MTKMLFRLLIACCTIGGNSFAQTDNNKEKLSVNAKIAEVFGSRVAEFAMSDPQRLIDLNDILVNRTAFLEVKHKEGEKYPKLSQVPLFNKYNPALQRDVIFEKEHFNVLKYDLQFFSKYSKIYRIDNTDYLLVIHPQIRK